MSFISPMGPIKTEHIKFKKCELLKNRLLIAIDSGNSLTKIVYLNKKNKDQLFDPNETSVIFEFNLFSNDHFEDAIEWIKSNAYFPEGECHTVHITGVNALYKQDKIKSILNMDVTFINEFLTISAGHRIAVEQIGVEHMLVDIGQVESYGEIENEMIKKFLEMLSNKIKKEENPLKDKSSPFPCLFHVHGSVSGCFYFDENGIGEYWGLVNPGGQTFLGLAKSILNSNDYDEIVTLAAAGNRCNVDTQVKEVLDDNKKSPYGGIPPDLPIFSFGKCMDLNKGKEEFKREDLAASLVSYHIQSFVYTIFLICKIKKIAKVYLTGNLFTSNVFLKEITKMTSFYPTGVDFSVLNFGYFGPLGAMFCEDSDMEKYCRGTL